MSLSSMGFGACPSQGSQLRVLRQAGTAVCDKLGCAVRAEGWIRHSHLISSILCLA